MILPRLDASWLAARRRGELPKEVLARAGRIVDDVRVEGRRAVERRARELEGRGPDDPLLLDREDLLAALASAPAESIARLERIAGRIRAFAEAQTRCLAPLTMQVPGGRAGHVFAPVERAGCYAPGGRYPLPSSILMTVIPARVAGVGTVWAATPRPRPIMLWAAALAGADGLLATGGAQAVAALAFGFDSLPACDIVVGPGNLWVTAAKRWVADRVAVDLEAGPSELLILADAGSDPELVAADLLAQAEHDTDAVPLLLTDAPDLLESVEDALVRQLADLPTSRIARQALAGGGVILCGDEAEMVRLANAVAPEHLQVSTSEPHRLAPRLTAYGALFLGEAAAEVFGDYGAGPNHVLPTGGAARQSGGLSVLSFLRLRTWMESTPDGDGRQQLIEDSAWLARQEGLEAHARAAERRGEN